VDSPQALKASLCFRLYRKCQTWRAVTELAHNLGLTVTAEGVELLQQIEMLQEIGGSEAIGPILMGIGKPIHVLQMGCSVQEIVDVTAMAVVDAQEWTKI